MTKLYSSLFLFTSCMLFAFNSHSQVIIDYYKLLSDYDDDVKMHVLSNENDQWYASVLDAGKVKIEVDAEHNFLELKDKEKDGIFTLQLSLLEKADGEILVALVKNHMDIFLHGEIHVLKYRNGRWNDVTQDVLPTITYKDFVEQTVSLAASAYNPQLNHHLEFGYSLPRKGNTTKALMQTQVLKERCKANDAHVKEYCASLNEITYSSIALIWNAKTGKFELGEKK